MKAMICPKYGPPEVLQLQDVQKPAPEENEVLIQNAGTSINTADIAHRSGKAPKAVFWGARLVTGLFLRLYFGGLRKPKEKIPGAGFAGKIVSVRNKDSNWKVGDRVYGYHKAACSEFMTVPEKLLAKVPTHLSLLDACAVPGGFSPAILAIRDLAQTKNGHKVLIIGASGGIGTFGVQIAKIYGAEVTAVCGTANVEMVKRIGADYVIDYTQDDYTKSGEIYDIIFDAIAASTLSKCRNILKSGGTYISNNPVNKPNTLFHLMTNFARKKKIRAGTADESAENLNSLYSWIEEGKLKPVIDKVFPLEQLADAHRHYETGHSKGRVVISID